MAANDNRDMAASLVNSPKNGKRSTSKTSELIPEEALEILTHSFSMVQQAGIILDVKEADGAVIVSIRNVTLENGVLVPAVPVSI